MSMHMMLLGAGGDEQPTVQNIQASNLSLDVQSFNPASSSSGTATVTNIAPSGTTNGVWTTNTSNNPSAGSANMVTETRNSKSIPAWNFSGGFDPSSGWIHFNGNATDFPGGSASFSCMWWVANDDGAGDFGLGGQDGSPTWTGGTNITNATAAINSKRSGQHELLGHGFDQRAGGGEGAASNSEWVCLVYVVSGSEFKIYRNGVFLGSTTYTGKNTANTNFFIGRSWSKQDLGGVNGKIAWTAFWKNTLLSQAEITQIWDQNYKYFGEEYVTLQLEIPATTNWVGINDLKVVVGGSEVQGNLTWDTQHNGCGHVGHNRMGTDSNYNAPNANDPRSAWMWTPNNSSGKKYFMRFPTSTIKTVSDIDYIQLAYHAGYVKSNDNLIISLNGKTLSYTRVPQGTSGDFVRERYGSLN